MNIVHTLPVQESYTIDGLTREQMGLILIMSSVTSGGYGYQVYEKILNAFGLDNDKIYELVKDISPIHITKDMINRALASK